MIISRHLQFSLAIIHYFPVTVPGSDMDLGLRVHPKP